ncbi:MAG: hypothetical protein F6K14_11290 [Symploca sp. SIO2C1]|nr:hypothetical protein [Symploca sp. SIO2C1]
MLNTYTSVAIRQEAGGRRQEAGGKKEGCKVEGNYNCLSELDISTGIIADIHWGCR